MCLCAITYICNTLYSLCLLPLSSFCVITCNYLFALMCEQGMHNENNCSYVISVVAIALNMEVIALI